MRQGVGMGTEALWIPAVMSAVAAGATAVNANNTAKRQDRAAAEGVRKQAQNQTEINAKINKTLQETKAQNPDDTRSAVNDQYLRQVQARLGQGRSGLTADTGLSSAYDEAATAAGSKVADFANSSAGLLSRIDAPGVQRQAEGMRYGNLGIDLDMSRGNIQGDQFLNNLRLRGIRNNPWIDAAAGVMSGAAAGVAAGGAGGATAPGTIAPTAYQTTAPWSLPMYVPGGG